MFPRIVSIFLSIFLPFLIGAVDLDSTFTISNSTSKDVKNDTKLNPENLLEMGYPLTDTLKTDVDGKLAISEMFSVTASDTLYGSYSWYEEEYDGQEDFDYDNTLKQLYLTCNLNSIFFIDAGRKVEKNGVSFYKNPSDFINNSELVSLTDSKDEQAGEYTGKTLIKGEYFITGSIVIDLLYSPRYTRIDNDIHIVQSKWSFQFDSSDFNLIGFYGNHFSGGTNVSTNVGDSAEIHIEFGMSEEKERYLVSDEDAPPGVDGPVTYAELSDSSMRAPWKAVFGGHYTFSDASDLYCEYYYNHSGYTESEWKRLTEAMDSYNDTSYLFNTISIYNINTAIRDTNGLTSARRHYVFFRYSKDDFFVEDFNFASVAVLGIEGPGGMFVMSPSYDANDNLDVGLNFSFFGGAKDSEFELMYNRFSFGTEISYTF